MFNFIWILGIINVLDSERSDEYIDCTIMCFFLYLLIYVVCGVSEDFL